MVRQAGEHGDHDVHKPWWPTCIWNAPKLEHPRTPPHTHRPIWKEEKARRVHAPRSKQIQIPSGPGPAVTPKATGPRGARQGRAHPRRPGRDTGLVPPLPSSSLEPARAHSFSNLAGGRAGRQPGLPGPSRAAQQHIYPALCLPPAHPGACPGLPPASPHLGRAGLPEAGFERAQPRSGLFDRSG